MSETLRIRVLKRHILRGKPMSECSCPIAHAVREVAPKHKRVSVGYETLQIAKKTYLLPGIARTFIDRFDTGNTVKPITFTATLKEVI